MRITLLLVAMGTFVVCAGCRAADRTAGQTSVPLAPASGESSDREFLDGGPWPTQGHDSRRTAQSHLAGPASAGPVQRLHDGTTALYWDSTLTGKDRSPLVARSDGSLVFGTCGSVSAIDLAGRAIWSYGLSGLPIRQGVSGLAVGADGALVVTTHQCPALGSARTDVQALDAAGKFLWKRHVGETYVGAALGPHGFWYTISDSNLVRAFGTSTIEPAWMTDTAGDLHGSIALDSYGDLYLGTNGGDFNRPALWSVAPDGRIRWSGVSGTVTTPVVGPGNRVYAAGNDELYCYDAGGTRLWAIDIGPVTGSWTPLAVGQSGTVYALTRLGLLAVAPDGRVKWTVPPDDGSSLSPGPILDRDENVYIGLRNTVQSFTRDGKPRWSAPLTAPGQMIIAADGVLCVVGERRRIYAIGARR